MRKGQDGFYPEELLKVADESLVDPKNMYLPYSFPPWDKSMLEKKYKPNSWLYNQSDILSAESRWDHKIIFSNDNYDIIKTIKAINSTWKGARKFAFKAFQKDMPRSSLTERLLNGFSIIENFGSMVLMNDNFYAFTYKPELSKMTIE